MNMIFGKNSLTTGFKSGLKLICVVLAILLPASSAWASNTATITSAGSADPANPTQVLIGDALHITGLCAGRGAYDVPVRADYLIYNSNNTGRFLVDGSYKPKSWLKDSNADVSVGTTQFTEAIGAKFHVELKCTGTQNTSYASRFFEVVAPQVAPTVAISGSWNAKYTKDDRIMIEAAVTSNGSGVGKVWIKWTGESAVNIEMTNPDGDRYLYPINLSGLSEGLKEVQIWAESPGHANNGWQTVGSFTVDRSAPAIDWDATNAQYAKTSITIDANVSDAVSGVADVLIWWPGAAGSIQMNKVSGDRYRYTIDTSQLPAGEKEVQILARDKAGNDTKWQVKGRFIVDRLAPKIEWDDDNAQYTKDEITIKTNVSDTSSGVANVWIWWTGAPSQNIKMKKGSGNQYEYTIPAIQEDGLKDVQIYATDNAGNIANWVSKGSFIVDHSSPEIEWDDSNPQYTKDEITIKTNVSDTSSGVANVWIWWTGAPSQNIKMKKGSGNQYEYTIPAIQEDGLKDVQIYATDNAGNIANWVSKGSFIVDRTPPIINWLEPLDQAVLSDGRIHIAGNIVDDNPDYVVIEWQAENATAWQSHTVATDANRSDFQYDLSGLTQGVNYRLRLRATDKAGNDAADTPSRTVIGQLPADTMLRLQLESMQADWKYTQGTAFDYRITVRALKSALSGIALRYTLPAGLQKNGDVRIDGDGAAAMILNPHWGGRDALLLSSAHGAMLAARNAFTVTIPVRVADTVLSGTFIQSEVQASADNLIGRMSAIHRLTLEGPPFDEEQLRLKKTVDKKTALPGEILHYTITFTNISTEDLNTLVIKDDIQSTYLTLRNAQCGQSIPDSLRCCVSTEQGDQCGTAIERKPGALEWHLNGILAAGDSGSVSYEAQVKQH